MWRASRFETVCKLTVLVGILGCAQIKHVPVDNFDSSCGIPYYQGSWYLLTYPDGQGNLAAQYYYLRDPSKKMSAEPRAWLASLSSTLTFNGGVLESSETTADSTAVPAALIEAAESFLKTLAAANEAAQKIRPGLWAPSIYKVRTTSPTTVVFIGEQTSYTVSVAGWSTAQ